METPIKVCKYVESDIGDFIRFHPLEICLIISNTTLVVFIPNFTATHAITYTNKCIYVHALELGDIPQ